MTRAMNTSGSRSVCSDLYKRWYPERHLVKISVQDETGDDYNMLVQPSEAKRLGRAMVRQAERAIKLNMVKKSAK